MSKPLLTEFLKNGILTVDGIMIKVQNRERLTPAEEEYLYQHGSVAQVSEAFRDYPLPEADEAYWFD